MGVEILFLVFLVLKLTGVVAWSWWWVTAPLWVSGAFYVIFLVVAGLIANKVNKDMWP